MAELTYDFVQARIKLKWAYEHIQRANAFWQRHLETDFCTITIEDQLKGEHVKKSIVVKAEPIPSPIILSIGDAVHNMRCALDYTISEMLHWQNARITFPMHETRDELVSSFRTKPEIIAGKTKKAGGNAPIENAVPTIAALIIDEIKPYKAGNNLLWALGKIDNTDKHRLILPTVIPTSITCYNVTDDHGNTIGSISASVGPGGIATPFASLMPGNLKVERYGKPTAEILFNEVGIIEGLPLFPTLLNMHKIVTETIDRIIKFLAEVGWEKPAPRMVGIID